MGIITNAGWIAKRLVSSYVRIFGIPEIGLHLRVREAVRRCPHDAQAAVDVGCGAGMLIGQLRRRLRHSRLVGIEPDASSCAVAKASHPYAKFENVDAATAANRLQARFDVAFSLDVLHFLQEDELPRFFAACYTMLKPGGCLVLHAPAREQKRHLRRFEKWGDPNYQTQGLDPRHVAALASAVGFNSIKVRPRTGYWASLAWELNMLLAGSPVQAVCFPVLLAVATAGELLPSSTYNTFICEARRPR